MSPSEDLDSMRGRKRDRSLHASSHKVPSYRKDESSTLRGRSRQRASSPFAAARISRNASPVSALYMLRHPGSAAALYKEANINSETRARLRRREHCPSRQVSPTRPALPTAVLAAVASGEASPRRRRERTRSRPSGRRAAYVLESFRSTTEGSSRLRNELRLGTGTDNEGDTPVNGER